MKPELEVLEERNAPSFITGLMQAWDANSKATLAAETAAYNKVFTQAPKDVIAANPSSVQGQFVFHGFDQFLWGKVGRLGDAVSTQETQFLAVASVLANAHVLDQADTTEMFRALGDMLGFVQQADTMMFAYGILTVQQLQKMSM